MTVLKKIGTASDNKMARATIKVNDMEGRLEMTLILFSIDFQNLFDTIELSAIVTALGEGKTAGRSTKFIKHICDFRNVKTKSIYNKI